MISKELRELCELSEIVPMTDKEMTAMYNPNKWPFDHNKLGDLLKDDRYELHHTAYYRGYVSRKADLEELPAIPYEGRFGRGYTVDLPSYESTRYCRRQYYIMKGVFNDGT